MRKCGSELEFWLNATRERRIRWETCIDMSQSWGVPARIHIVRTMLSWNRLYLSMPIRVILTFYIGDASSADGLSCLFVSICVYSCRFVSDIYVRDSSWLFFVQNYLFVFIRVYSCLFVSIHVYSCLSMSTHVSPCLSMSIHVYRCPFMWIHVYSSVFKTEIITTQ